MELYYNFLNMDSDRYMLDGELQQVLLAARELDPDNLPNDARNWVNRRLQYTHGYGVAMSPATGFTPEEGRPEFVIQDIPIRGEIDIKKPELYYGESPAPFALVNSTAPEINPPGAGRHYDGDGGVKLDSTFRRLVYAWQFADINILLSDQISPDTRIQYRRNITDRVQALAPFLIMDDDPYPVVGEEGKIWWLQDAFTTTNRYSNSFSLSFSSRIYHSRPCSLPSIPHCSKIISFSCYYCIVIPITIYNQNWRNFSFIPCIGCWTYFYLSLIHI